MRCPVLSSAFYLRLTIGLVSALVAAAMLLTPAFAVNEFPDTPADPPPEKPPMVIEKPIVLGSDTPEKPPMVIEKPIVLGSGTSSTPDPPPPAQESPPPKATPPDPPPPAQESPPPKATPPDQTQPKQETPSTGHDASQNQKATTPPPTSDTKTEPITKAPATKEPDYQLTPKKEASNQGQLFKPAPSSSLALSPEPTTATSSQPLSTRQLLLDPASDSPPPQQNQSQPLSGGVFGLLAQPSSNEGQLQPLSGGIGNLITAQPLSVAQEGASPEAMLHVVPLRGETNNPLGGILGLAALAAIGLLLAARSMPLGRGGRSSSTASSTSDEASERASAVRGGGKSTLAKTITDAGADAATSYTDGRAATAKGAGSAATPQDASSAASGGAGQGGVSGQTAPDPGTQSTQSVSDTVPNVVPMGWLPGKHIRLLVADDNEGARTGLRGMLESQPDFEVVGEATTSTDVVELTDRLHPKVILMDLHMPPEMDATETIAAIKAEHPHTRTLVLSMYDSDADLLAAIEAGATSYLLKDAPREELFEAIRTAAQGKPRP